MSQSIMQLYNKQHVPIYVISLSRDTQRRECLQKHFLKYWPFMTLVNAIDGCTLPSYYPPIHPALARKPMTNAEIACALSHLMVMESFLQSPYRSCIILEDDIEGNDTILDKTVRLMRVIPDGAFVLLGGQQCLRNPKYVYGKPRLVHGIHIWHLFPASLRFIARTCCYGLTKPVAKQLITKQTSGLSRSDHWTYLLEHTRDVYYADLLRHPTSQQNSHIEPERQAITGTVWPRIRADGILYTISSQVIKFLVLPLIARFCGLERVSISGITHGSERMGKW